MSKTSRALEAYIWSDDRDVVVAARDQVNAELEAGDPVFQSRPTTHAEERRAGMPPPSKRTEQAPDDERVAQLEARVKELESGSEWSGTEWEDAPNEIEEPFEDLPPAATAAPIDLMGGPNTAAEAARDLVAGAARLADS